MITPADVLSWLDQEPDASPPGSLTLAVEAVNTVARRRCYPALFDADLDGVDDDPIVLAADMKLALVMQASRWWRRNQTPDGIAGFADEGTAVRVSRFDPDIDTMLVDYLKPAFA